MEKWSRTPKHYTTHVYRLCPLVLSIKLNFNVLKEACYCVVILFATILHFFSMESSLCIHVPAKPIITNKMKSVSMDFQAPSTNVFFFNELQGVWKSDETLIKVLLKPKFVMIKIAFSSFLHDSGFLCFMKCLSV